MTPASIYSKLGEVKDLLMSRASPELETTNTAKRRRQKSPYKPGDSEEDDESDSIMETEVDINPSTVRAFNILFHSKLAEVTQPFTDMIHELRSIIEEKDARIRDLEQQLAAARNATAPAAENGPIRAENDTSRELAEVKLKLDHYEQHSRRFNLRLHGVPDKQNTAQLVSKIAVSMGVELAANDIRNSHYLGAIDKKNKTRQIIVEFANPQARIDLLSNRRKLREPEHEYGKVYINEDLTRQRYMLLRAMQAKKKYNLLHAAWSFSGKLCYKLTSSVEEKPVIIKNPLTFNVDNAFGVANEETRA